MQPNDSIHDNADLRSDSPEDWGDQLQAITPIQLEDQLSATVPHEPYDPFAAPDVPTTPSSLPPAPLVPVSTPPAQAKPQRRRRRLKLRRRWQVAVLALVIMPLAACTLFSFVYLLIPPPPMDLLILGIDARPGEGYVTRTDAIMLLGVKPRQMKVSLLSVPRDLFINVPGYGSQRINTVNVLGELEEPGYGPELLSAGINASFGIQPDRYARLNFDAFVQLVDAVGGLRIDVPKTIVDNQYPTRDYGTIAIRFDPGVQQMDGERALIYARTRHADDDYGRAERQQQVLSALARKLANPFNWGAALNVITRNVDTNMSVVDMALYAPPMILGGQNIDRLVIDREYVVGGTSGAIPNYEKLAPWLESRFD